LDTTESFVCGAWTYSPVLMVSETLLPDGRNALTAVGRAIIPSTRLSHTSLSHTRSSSINNATYKSGEPK